MRRAATALLVLAPLAAGAIDLGEPLRDERRVVTGRVGDGAAAFFARGQYVTGARTDRGAYDQGGGEVAGEFAAIAFPTGLGGMFGFEGELSLGLMRSEQYADGTLSDQRKDSQKDDPAKLWLTLRAGLRWVICPRPIFIGDSALRLGLVGGLQLEGSGARSWTMAGAFTAGAHVSFGTDSFGAIFSWLAIPPQGNDDQLNVRHQLGLDLGIGPVVIGARVQFDHLDVRGMSGLMGWQLDSQTFSLAAGFRTGPLKF
ncbi:MAG: hypothetical protein U0228_19790 [Myxococcaceae bacterium]